MVTGIGGGGGVEGRAYVCVRAHARARANGSVPLRGALTAPYATPPATPCIGPAASDAARQLTNGGAGGGEQGVAGQRRL